MSWRETPSLKAHLAPSYERPLLGPEAGAPHSARARRPLARPHRGPRAFRLAERPAIATGQVLLEDGTPKLAPHLWPARRRLGSCIVHASFMHFWWEGLVDVGGNVDGGGDLLKPMDKAPAKDRLLRRLPALPHPHSGSCLVHAASRKRYGKVNV